MTDTSKPKKIQSTIFPQISGHRHIHYITIILSHTAFILKCPKNKKFLSHRQWTYSTAIHIYSREKKYYYRRTE